MAYRAAEQREKVGARPVHQLGDGHLCGKGPPHLQPEPFLCGGPGQIAGRDPCDFDHLATIEGSKVLPDLTDVSVVIQGTHPGVEVVRAFTLSPAAGDLPFPQGKGGLLQFGHLGDDVLPYHNYESTAVRQGAGFPSRTYLPSGERCRAWKILQRLAKPLHQAQLGGERTLGRTLPEKAESLDRCEWSYQALPAMENEPVASWRRRRKGENMRRHLPEHPSRMPDTR